MAKLLEYKGKHLLEEAGIKTPKGEIATNAQEAKSIAAKIGRPVAVKAQVLAPGRFEAGGIRFGHTPEQAAEAAEQLLG